MASIFAKFVKRDFFHNLNADIMDQNNQVLTIKNAVGMAGGAVLLAPVSFPVLHALTGVAVAGLGLFAAGTLVFKTVSALTGGINPTTTNNGAD